jgi:GMP synthase (glutamine-hydrolysing)
MLVIIQNDPEVSPGAFAGFLAEMGVPYRIARPYAGDALPPVAELSAAIVLGGAMGVHDTDRYPFLAEVKRFVRECATCAVPLLGICLGGQILADAMGGRVTANSCGEKGTLTVHLSPAGERDPLFTGMPAEFVTFQWHNDCFALPDAAELLAFSAACPGQAFRLGAHCYGLQFHPEVDWSIVGLWARETAETAASVERFLADFTTQENPYRSASRQILNNFLGIARLV